VHFQELILRLQAYWSDQGCVILQPYDMEVGAGTFHTATFLTAVGPEPSERGICSALPATDRRAIWREPESTATLLSVSGRSKTISGQLPGAISGLT